MNTVKFNLNDKVRVKLTDLGRKIHKDNFYEFCLDKFYDYNPPKEDVEGWSEWQMWDLFGLYGKHLYNGAPLVFETTIELIVD